MVDSGDGAPAQHSRPGDEQRAYWDREYSGPHPKWKGPPRDGPSLDLGGRVLELGCGNGKTAAALAQRGAEVVAVDFSVSGLRACRRSIGDERLDVVLADVRLLPFSDRAFDAVVASHVLGHLLQDGREEAMREARRVLRPGGTLAFRAFSVRDMRFGQGVEEEEGTYRRGTGIRTHFFDQEEVRSLASGLEELSLAEIVSRKRYGGVERTRAEWSGTFRKY